MAAAAMAAAMVADVSEVVTVAAVRGVGSRERVVVGSRAAPLACTRTPVSLPVALVERAVEARGVADLGGAVGVVAAAEAVGVVAATEAARATRAVRVPVVAEAGWVAVRAAVEAVAVMDLEAVEAVEAVETISDSRRAAAQRCWLCPASRSTARVAVARAAAVVGWVAPLAAVVGRAVAVARVGWVEWVD